MAASGAQGHIAVGGGTSPNTAIYYRPIRRLSKAITSIIQGFYAKTGRLELSVFPLRRCQMRGGLAEQLLGHCIPDEVRCRL